MRYKVLVYVDHTTCGQWALTHCKELLTGLDAGVILLTTAENLQKDPQLLDRIATDIQKCTGREVETKSRPGPAREAIVAESLESRPALTIFPPAGRSSLARMFKGSRVKSVVHNSPSTVMVARKPVSEHISRVLLTISGGPMSQTTLLSAHEIVQALKAELTILHVRSSVSLPSVERDSTGEGSPGAVPEISELVAELDWGDAKDPGFKFRSGMVVTEILGECQQGHYDLLVMGQHLATEDAGGPWSQDIAEILAMESPIPVLIVRPRRWAEAKMREK